MVVLSFFWQEKVPNQANDIAYKQDLSGSLLHVGQSLMVFFWFLSIPDVYNQELEIFPQLVSAIILELKIMHMICVITWNIMSPLNIIGNILPQTP